MPLKVDSIDYQSLIRPMESRMIKTIGRVVRDVDEADDVLQEALLTIWRKRRNIAAHPNPEALMLRICANAAYDALRKARRAKWRPGLMEIEHLPDPRPSADRELESSGQLAEISDAIGRLSRKQAAVVIMRFVQELSYDDIARAMGCTQATARKHIERARTKLKKELRHLLTTRYSTG